MTTILYLVRHGQSVMNTLNIVQGNDHADSWNGLSDVGIAQANDIANKLTQVTFDVCYHSPLQRAEETAKYIIASRGIPVSSHPKFRDKAMGDSAGKAINAINEAYTNWDKITEDERLDIKLFPNEESQRELRVRSLAIVHEIASLNQGKTILIVTHGSFIRSLYIYLSNKSIGDLNRFDNCGYMILEYTNTLKIISTYKLSLKIQT